MDVHLHKIELVLSTVDIHCLNFLCSDEDVQQILERAGLTLALGQMPRGIRSLRLQLAVLFAYVAALCVYVPDLPRAKASMTCGSTVSHSCVKLEVFKILLRNSFNCAMPQRSSSLNPQWIRWRHRARCHCEAYRNDCSVGR